jgi:hypothetical protein
MPTEAMNFFVRYGEVMSEIANAEAFYDVNLKKPFREISALYWKWSKGLLANKLVSGHYEELRRLEFSTYCAICDQIASRLSELVRSLDRLILVDTSQLKVMIEQTRQKKATAESHLNDENKVEECITSIKAIVDDVFKAYSDWKAKRKNLERKALLKWLGGMGGGYGISMAVYYQALSNMQILSNSTYGVVIPITVVLLLLLFLLALFSQD